MKRHALIVAGGKGLRMGAEIPKQFLELNGLPVLMHTIKAFRFDPKLAITLVLPADQFTYWKWLCEKHGFNEPHQLVAGGASRFQSVKNGLLAIAEAEALVAIHDGVRPLIDKEIIENSYKIASEKGNALVVVKLKDSIRKQDLLGNSKGVNRENYYLVQTPQTFEVAQILQAYELAEDDNFTDDASVLEASGQKINLIEGSYRNLKITTPEDLIVASDLLQ
jgi:2-C-methyl-D-erythritol 4-phosphate cytidylyltransferase